MLRACCVCGASCLVQVVEAFEDLPRIGADDVLLERAKGFQQVGDGAAGTELHEDVEVGVRDVDGDVGNCQMRCSPSHKQGANAGRELS
jgi:hypothetical protein